MVWVIFLLKSGRGQRVNIFILNLCLEEAEKWKMGCKCLFLFPFKKPNFVILPALKVCRFFEGLGAWCKSEGMAHQFKRPGGVLLPFLHKFKSCGRLRPVPKGGERMWRHSSW